MEGLYNLHVLHGYAHYDTMFFSYTSSPSSLTDCLTDIDLCHHGVSVLFISSLDYNRNRSCNTAAPPSYPDQTRR